MLTTTTHVCSVHSVFIFPACGERHLFFLELYLYHKLGPLHIMSSDSGGILKNIARLFTT